MPLRYLRMVRVGSLNDFGSYAVALSPNGRLLAIGSSPLKVIDLASGRVIYTVPAQFTIRHLRYLDDGQKLLVVQAMLGQGDESPSTGSDMQFLIWDLKRRELFSFHHTGTTGDLLREDLVWTFSEETGELWAINTNGHSFTQDRATGKQVEAKIEPYRVNMKLCGGPTAGRIELEGGPSSNWQPIPEAGGLRRRRGSIRPIWP